MKELKPTSTPASKAAGAGAAAVPRRRKPGRPRADELQGEGLREGLIAAAARVYGNHGFRGASVELIAREAGKPLWEARSEVDAVVNKVDISVQAYAERTGKKKFDAGIGASAAVRHKPHGVMVVLGPYNTNLRNF